MVLGARRVGPYMACMQKIMAAAFAVLVLSACSVGAEQQGSNREFPISSDFPPGTMERTEFIAGVPEGWRISALRTPERPNAPWKIVIVTGTPSWSEYWAPTIAALPATRELIVADRPGFRDSEPQGAVLGLNKQADALSPVLQARPGQRVLLVGQSFGAPVATLMAQRYPEKVQAMLVMSGFFGNGGPTARRLIAAGRVLRPLLERDLRNSLSEVSAQRAQLPGVFAAMEALTQPVVFVHGEEDDFVPFASDRAIADRYSKPVIGVPGGDHFLNACCVPALLAAMENAIARADAAAN